MRRAVIITVGLAATYIAVEFLSYLGLAAANSFKPSAFIPVVEGDYLSDLRDDDVRAYIEGGYDPLLGWHNVPGSQETDKNCLKELWTESFDADGSRSTPQDFDTTLIASYGDSYVKGGEINNDQTWQFQLAQQIGSGVKNYAVGAFDPYQSLLKIKRHISEDNVYPITILGINEQNVTRVVNLYRPFLYRTVRSKLAFKPGFACNGEQCVPVENLLRPETHTIDEVKRIAHEARQLDYWARTKPALEYPWTLNLLRAGRYALMMGASDEPEPLWIEPEGATAMHMVVSDFRDSVQKAGSLPVVLFIPTKPRKDKQPSYRFFKKRIADEYPDLIVLDVADSEFDPKRFKLKPTGACHPSEYGHSVIASTVREGLQDILEQRAVQGEWPIASN